jgi:hypothetical protein
MPPDGQVRIGNRAGRIERGEIFMSPGTDCPIRFFLPFLLPSG